VRRVPLFKSRSRRLIPVLCTVAVTEEEPGQGAEEVPEAVKNVGYPHEAAAAVGEEPQGEPTQTVEEIENKKKALGVDQPEHTAGAPETAGERVFPGPSEPRKSVISTEAGSSVVEEEEHEPQQRKEELPGYYHGKEVKELAFVRGVFRFSRHTRRERTDERSSRGNETPLAS
jgi:hypothetical protein